MAKRWKNTLTPNMPDFIAAWREAAGMNQDEMAHRIGMSKGNYSKTESGKQGYDPDFLNAVAYVVSEKLNRRIEPGDLIMRDPADPRYGLLDSIRSVDEAAPAKKRA